MNIENRIANAFKMDESTWTHHANPWSVWTRTTVLPLLILAFWSRIWLGWWSLLAIIVAFLWTWLNPRIFTGKRAKDNWASKAVFGERIWLNRNEIPIPIQHRNVPKVLSSVSAVGAMLVIWGVTTLDLWPTFLGTVMIYLSKLWFLDRMVWLYEDMCRPKSEY